MRSFKQFFLLSFLLVIAQILISNYIRLGPFLILSVLPALVLCIPTRVPTWQALLLAFVAGMAVDLLAEGVAGLHTLSLLPVALARLVLVRFICGEDLLARRDDFSIKRNGWAKVSLCLLSAQALYLLFYIPVDSAGTRPFWFDFLRFNLSLLVGTVVSLFVADLLSPEDRR